MQVTGCVARLMTAAVLVAAAASSHADPPDPWAGPVPAERSPEEPADSASSEPLFPTRTPEDVAARAVRIDRARHQALDDTFQADLPDGSADTALGHPAGQPRRRAGGELADRAGRTRVDARHREPASAVSSLMTTVMWGMVIVIGALAALWFISELSKYGGDAALPPDRELDDRATAAAAIVERPLEDADVLARHGAYAEAIHTLLLRTLQELVRSAAVRVAPAMTSREILARVPLLGDARSALAGLITAVEVTHFGDEPANAGDYERCRQQFHVFAAAFRNAARPAEQAVAA